MGWLWLVEIKGLSKLQEKIVNLERGVARLPASKGKNPLVLWHGDYRRNTKKAMGVRPTVGQSGTFRGSRWPALEPAYTRKDGTEIPVWGGVARLRAGRVTRASGAGIRVKAAGPGIIKKGQTFGGKNVLGKLKKHPPGHRYKSSDKQLGVAKGQSLLQRWLLAAPKLTKSGRRLTMTVNVPYARSVSRKRPFHWSRRIEQEERRFLRRRAEQYLNGLV